MNLFTRKSSWSVSQVAATVRDSRVLLMTNLRVLEKTQSDRSKTVSVTGEHASTMPVKNLVRFASAIKSILEDCFVSAGNR